MDKISVKIGKFTFDGVKELEVNTSIRSIAGTCKIELPLRAVIQNKQRFTLEKEIKRGNAVLIKINDNQEFIGFVASITAGDTLSIECEDNAYQLRSSCENKVFAKTTLNQLLKHIINGTDIELNAKVPAVELLNFTIKDISRLSALQKLKDEYSLGVFFDTKGCLYAGLEDAYKSGNVNYHLQKNVIETDLKFTQNDDMRFKVEAKSRLKTNKLITITFGDEDGDLRTFVTYGIESESELKTWAKNELAKIKKTGIDGSIATFGLPIAQIGMSAQLTDDVYPIRNGRYLIESVKTTFGQNGYKRTVELGVKLN